MDVTTHKFHRADPDDNYHKYRCIQGSSQDQVGKDLRLNMDYRHKDR